MKKKHRHKWTYGGDCPCCGEMWEECIAGDYVCEAIRVNGKLLAN